jgi:hypothetical protein
MAHGVAALSGKVRAACAFALVAFVASASGCGGRIDNGPDGGSDSTGDVDASHACPRWVPAWAAPCAPDGLSCNYDESGNCVLATCQSGKWNTWNFGDMSPPVCGAVDGGRD